MNMSQIEARLMPQVAPRPDTIKSVYAHLDCLVDGIDGLKRAGFQANIVVTAPLARHEIEEMLYEGEPSPVRWYTMFGAIFGGICGFSLPAITHMNWPMIMSAGKPIVSIPPFLIITFEATVLMGCLFTLIGMVIHCRLPANNLQVEVTDPRFSDDVFGLIVNDLQADDAARVRSILDATGAIEVTGMEAARVSA